MEAPIVDSYTAFRLTVVPSSSTSDMSESEVASAPIFRLGDRTNARKVDERAQRTDRTLMNEEVRGSASLGRPEVLQSTTRGAGNYADIGEGKKRKYNEREDTDEFRHKLSELERDDRQVDRVTRQCMRKRLLLLVENIDILSQADIENQLGILQRHAKALAT